MTACNSLKLEITRVTVIKIVSYATDLCYWYVLPFTCNENNIWLPFWYSTSLIPHPCASSWLKAILKLKFPMILTILWNLKWITYLGATCLQSESKSDIRTPKLYPNVVTQSTNQVVLSLKSTYENLTAKNWYKPVNSLRK